MCALNQPKLLHVINTISRGGAENHLIDLVSQQAKLGYQITVAYLQREGYWRTRLQKLGVQVIDLKLPLRRYGDPRPIFRLRSLIQTWQPDIVHAHLPPAELYTRFALLGISSQKLPLVVTKHNTAPFYQGFQGRGHRWLGRWVSKRTSRIIAISEAVTKHLCGSGLGCSPQKVATIHYGFNPTPYEIVSPEDANKLRQEWGVSDNDYLIGTVARLEPPKALHILLEGFAFYVQQSSHPTKLVLVGTGSLETELKQLATKLGLDKHIIWAGFRDDIPTVMNALDLMALTSVREGFGLVLLEAMATGKPVVATNVSAIPEVVTDGLTGQLILPERPDLLVEALQFFEDPEKRSRFGKAGSQRVKSDFTLWQMTKKTASVYEQVLKEYRLRLEQSIDAQPHEIQ